MEASTLALLTENDFQDFLFANESIDERVLVLKHKTLFGIPAATVANQISGRRKAKTKLPTYYSTKGIVYPPTINIEQSSSQGTALFKAEIIRNYFKRDNLIGADLTGGLGVDSFFLGSACSTFHYVEKVEPVVKLAQHNHSVLGATHIQHHQTSAEEFINSTKHKFDFIFVDPSRRVKQAKVVKLSDCEPAINFLLPKVFDSTHVVLIKASPLLDLQQGIKELQHVKREIGRAHV